MKNIACIICNELSYEEAIFENGYSGKRCRRCKLIYISPRPELHDLEEAYNSENRSGYGTSPFLSKKLRYRSEHAKQIEAYNSLNIIRNFKKDGKILEIGPGLGSFLIMAGKQGYKPTGLEINPSRAKYLQENDKLKCLAGSIEAMDPDVSDKFDIIYNRDVVSHLYNPKKAFKICWNLLSNGGIIVIETGNVGELSNFWLRMYRKFEYPGHLFFFSEKSLTSLLKQNGFEVIATFRYSFILDILYLNLIAFLKTINRFIIMHLIQNKAVYSFNNDSENNNAVGFEPAIFDKLVRFMNAIRSLLRYKAGKLMKKKGSPSQIVVVAQKKVEK